MKPTTYHEQAGDAPAGGGTTLLNDPALTTPPPPQDGPQGALGVAGETPPAILTGWTGDGGTLKPEFLDAITKTHPELAPTFGKYKTEGELFKGIANLAMLAGKKTEGIRIPGADAKPEELAEFRKALGVPDTVDGYNIAAPESLPEGVTWDETAVKGFAEILHKNNVPPAVASDLIAFDLQRRASEIEAFKAEEENHIEGQRAALRTEYGAELPAKLEAARRAAALIGLPEDHYALADATVIKALVNLAGKVSEDSFTAKGAQQSAGDLNSRVRELMKSDGYKNGDAATRAEVHRLNIEIAKLEGTTD